MTEYMRQADTSAQFFLIVAKEKQIFGLGA